MNGGARIVIIGGNAEDIAAHVGDLIAESLLPPFNGISTEVVETRVFAPDPARGVELDRQLRAAIPHFTTSDEGET